jgi:hypothetical protein
MLSKTIFCFVVFSLTKRFLGGSLDAMISLFLKLCESLRINILLRRMVQVVEHGRQHNYKGDDKI